MTTPVLSTAGQQRERGNRMAFVMESKYGTSLKSLPVPQDSRSVLLLAAFKSTLHRGLKYERSRQCTLHRVMTKEQESCVMAALSFGGLPLDFQVCLLVHRTSLFGKCWHSCYFGHS